MTDIEWGAEIAVNGVRPDWLKDDDMAVIWDACKYRPSPDGDIEGYFWSEVERIALPANHAYYTATSRGFTYWPGGDTAPADWDGGTVLLRGEQAVKPSKHFQWDWRDPSHWNISGDIIGYRKRTEQPAPAIAPELVERMVALLRRIADGKMLGAAYKAQAILAELEPADPDMTLAKSINGDAEAIALAIKAARENAK